MNFISFIQEICWAAAIGSPKAKPKYLPTGMIFSAKLSVLALALASLLGCKSTTTREDAVAQAPTEETPAVLYVPDKSFTEESLYSLLVAEMAIDRNRPFIALNNYRQQAEKTRDLGVTSRATQIARILKRKDIATEMAGIWLELEPENTEAQLVMVSGLVDKLQLEDAFELAKKLYDTGKTNVFDAIAAKASTQSQDVVASFIPRYKTLLEHHPEDSRILSGYSILLQSAGKLEEALGAMQASLRADPDNIHAALQETHILTLLGRDKEAVEKMGVLVKRHSGNKALRVRYARALWADYPEKSNNEFEALHQKFPHDPEILYSLALIEKENKNLDRAQALFEDLLMKGVYVEAAHFHLGSIAELKKADDDALDHFLKVDDGEFQMRAIAKSADIYIQRNEGLKALNLVRGIKRNAVGPKRASLYMLEASVLKNQKQEDAALFVLSDALDEFPGNASLLYSRAMLYTELDKDLAAERDFQNIINADPKHSAALNALGYTLADRNVRLQEAKDFIDRALAITPDDPAVLDSKGWVEYRLGNFEIAVKYLTKAMEQVVDHEIASHLGEVFWVQGEQDKARETWRKGLEQKPDSEIIRKTIERLGATLN